MKTILITLFTLLLTINSFAQKQDREIIKALKVAHITEQLDLTEKEAQTFWPVYNANEEAKHKLRENSTNIRKEKNTNDLTEIEAKALILEMVDIENNKQQLSEKFITKLLTILPAKKVISLMQAERSFRSKMIEKFKERHRGDKSKNKRN